MAIFFFSEIGQCNHNSEGWTVTVKGKSIELSICRKPGQRDFSPFFLCCRTSSNPTQYARASVFHWKLLVCHFVKLMAFVRALSLHTFLWGRTLLFISSWGPRVFYKEKSGEGNRRGAWQPFFVCVGGVLCFCWPLILFFSWCQPFQRISSWSEERLCQLFLTPFSFFVSHPQLKGSVLKCFNHKTRVSDMWQGHNAWMGQPA